MAPLDTRNRSLILYAVRLDYLDKLLKKDQRQLVEDNPQANKKVPVFYVGQTTLLAWQRYENHRNGHRDSKWVRKYVQHLIRVDEWEPDSAWHCRKNHQGRMGVGPAQQDRSA